MIIFTRPMRNLILLSALFIVTMASAQEPSGNHEGRRGPRVKPRQTPFPAVAKAVGFAPIFADKSEFIEMGAFVSVLTPMAVPGMKGSPPAVQLVYGFRKGGIGCVYEVTKPTGMDPLRVFQAALGARLFGDRQYFKGWTIKGVSDKSLLIAVSGTTPQVRDALIKALRR